MGYGIYRCVDAISEQLEVTGMWKNSYMIIERNIFSQSVGSTYVDKVTLKSEGRVLGIATLFSDESVKLEGRLDIMVPVKERLEEKSKHPVTINS